MDAITDPQINVEEELLLVIKKGVFWVAIVALLVHFSAPGISQGEECTIGVASGTATQDGRPMIWKTRDYLSELDNEVRFNPDLNYSFIYVTGSGSSTSARMGVNEHGLAIVNSNATDLDQGSGTGLLNGELIRDGLGNCLTVEEFQDYLDETNQTGRRTNGNFAVIDSTGAASMFEVSETAYWRYNASDDPKGYVLRTNFSINGGGSTGQERLIRSVKLVGDFHSGDSLNYKSILRYQMRDFSDYASNPFPLPFDGSYGGKPHGYIETALSICRNSSVSASVITGILPGEFTEFSTMWTILGQPAGSVALPYWPIGYPPYEADGVGTSPLCDVAKQIRWQLFDYSADGSFINSYKVLDGQGGGLWTKTFPYEDVVFDKVEELLDGWRSEEILPVSDMQNTQDSLATKTYHFLQSCLGYILDDGHKLSSFNSQPSLYPNPFTSDALLTYELLKRSDVQIEIYTLAGVLIESASFIEHPPGIHQYFLDPVRNEYPEGMLILRLSVNRQAYAIKLIYNTW